MNVRIFIPYSTAFTLLKAYGVAHRDAQALADKAQFVICGDADSQIVSLQKLATFAKTHGKEAALDFLKAGQR